MIQDFMKWQSEDKYFVYTVPCKHGVQYVGKSKTLARPAQHYKFGGGSRVTNRFPPVGPPTIIGVFQTEADALLVESLYVYKLRQRGNKAFGGGFMLSMSRNVQNPRLAVVVPWQETALRSQLQDLLDHRKAYYSDLMLEEPSR